MRQATATWRPVALGDALLTGGESSSASIDACEVEVGYIVIVCPGTVSGRERTGTPAAAFERLPKSRISRASDSPGLVTSRAGRKEPQDAVEERICGGLEASRRGPRYPAGSLLGPDAQRNLERNRLALSTMQGRADLVGFRLTTRLRGLGRVSTVLREALRRLLFQVLHRQTEFNKTSIELIRTHETQLEVLGATVRAQLEIQAAAEERLDAHEHSLARMEASVIPPERRAAPSPSPTPMDLDRLSFTERFDGATQERSQHLSRFVARFDGRMEVVDAGCGRGEFLDLLLRAGVRALGVDSDEAMVSHCRKLGLEAVHDDVLHFLRDCPSESQGGIFAGHLVEQLQREDVVDFVRLVFTRLRPGGVLVLETVNPLCLLTYARFYSDFTNVAPVPPQALQWLAESCGFASAEIEYHSPVPAEQKLTALPASAGGEAEVEAFNRGLDAANDLLFGFQEYALIARKPV